MHTSHSPYISYLPPLECDTPESAIVGHGLPPILPHFFVPHLVDKPQNPILETLKGTATVGKLLVVPKEDRFPIELTGLTEHFTRPPKPQLEHKDDSLWSNAARNDNGERVEYNFFLSLQACYSLNGHYRVRSCPGMHSVAKGVGKDPPRFFQSNATSHSQPRGTSEVLCLFTHDLRLINQQHSSSFPGPYGRHIRCDFHGLVQKLEDDRSWNFVCVIFVGFGIRNLHPSSPRRKATLVDTNSRKGQSSQ